MGLYPVMEVERYGNVVAIRQNDFSGLVVTRYYQEIMTIEERTNCFCCSCGDRLNDPACRNHGFAGRRPCLEHDMPGSPWDDDMIYGPGEKPADYKPEMPESVQWMREMDNHPWHARREDCVNAPHSHWPKEPVSIPTGNPNFW